MDESKVPEALSYPTRRAQRKKALKKIRLEGNFHYNAGVLSTEKGDLILVGNPTLANSDKC